MFLREPSLPTLQAAVKHKAKGTDDVDVRRGFSREAELTIDEAIEDVFNQCDEVLLDKPLV